MDRILKRPVSVSENRNHAAVSGVCVNVHRIAADHKILVDHGIVDAVAPALLQSLILIVPDGVGEAHTQRQVARRIFIKQGVIEQIAALSNGRALGTKAHSPK